MEDIEKISDELSALLDGYENELPDKYFLDVSTVGVERPIRNEEELKDAVGNYIYVKTAKNEYYGDLEAYEDGILKLSVKDKTRMKTVEVDYKEVKKVRYAVKF
jgi:ribosome maturation factor RimP